MFSLHVQNIEKISKRPRQHLDQMMTGSYKKIFQGDRSWIHFEREIGHDGKGAVYKAGHWLAPTRVSQ
ncbi:Retinal Guanylyl Cyclase 1 [Manis pentadactyla]|nr:Retinal Guanylyl Cyclase 1 [Manis pentadactyla]